MKTTVSDTLLASSTNTGLASFHEEIAARADMLWREKGCPQGCDEEIWLEAERELLRRRPLSVRTVVDGVRITLIDGAVG